MQINILSTSDNASYINVNYKNIKFRFLLDTGASISIIKLQKLKLTNLRYNPKDNIIINGLSVEAPVSTVGSITLPLQIHNKTFDCKFYVVKQESNIPFDGLIGNDFLEKEEATINYKNSTLTINSLPFPVSLQLNSNPTQSQSYILNSRSETIIKVDVLNPEIVQGICPEMNICDGVYLAKSLLQVDDESKALTTIINTNDHSIKVNYIQVVLEEFNEKLAQPLHNNTSNENFSNSNYSQNHKYENKLQHSIMQISKDPQNYIKQKSNSKRIELLRENLRLDHLNPEEKESVLNTCISYNDIFYLPNDKLTCTDTIQHEIRVTDPKPVHSKIYRYPPCHKEEVNKQINKMLQQGIIRPSVSPYSSPLWVVPKKSDASGEKKWRIVVDYRNLNNVTVGDAYPLPNIEEILDQLGHSNYFTTLDLANGFHQIPMKPEDAPKTAFSTPTGIYEFLRMPFGLRNAPACFQRLMNIVLTGLQGLQCFVYLDDIVLYARTINEHTSKLNSVFQRLRENKLLLQPDKCEFMRLEVAYLGHIISSKGVSPNPEKIKAIKCYPAPKNEKQIKQFLGLIGYYRRFIKNFSELAKPLTKLLKKDIPFTWGNEQNQSFETFRKILTTSPILQYPNFEEKFILTTDASNYAIGAVLSQGPIGKDLPIAYASRTLDKAEEKYSTIEKELLAIFWAVNHFRPYLYGREFTLITDHKPLTWLKDHKNPNSRLFRWKLRLEEYNYSIQYKPGKINNNADALSRNPVMITNQSIKETYDEFIKFHSQTLDIPNINPLKDEIFNKFPNAFIFSRDLDENNQYFQNIDSKFDLKEIPEDIKLYDNYKFTKSSQNTFLIFCKFNHFDKLEYKDLFYSFLKLRDTLFKSKIKILYLNNPLNTNPNIKINVFSSMIEYIFNKNKIQIILIDNPRINPKSKDEILQILHENHSSSIAGHSGYIRTYKRIKENYKWHNMKSDIKNFIKSCKSCQMNKTNHKPTKTPMQITTTSEKPFQKLAIDIVGPLNLTSNGNKFILTMQDDLTKYSYAKALQNHEAITIANSLLEFITIFGIPETLLTDQGSDFCSNIIKELNKLFKIKHVFSTPYHPQTNGSLERSHLTLKEYLKHYINQNQTDWDEYISLAMFTYNTHVHRSTEFTPYELIFGHKAYIPTTISQNPQFKYTYDDFYSQLQLKLNRSHEIAREKLLKSKEKSKNYSDNKINVPKFKINDLVIILNKQTKPGLSKKLSPNYRGPYKIVDIQNNNAKLEIKRNKFVKYHLNMLKPFVTNDNFHNS